MTRLSVTWLDVRGRGPGNRADASRTVIAMMRVMLGLGIAWRPAARLAVTAAETAGRCGRDRPAHS